MIRLVALWTSAAFLVAFATGMSFLSACPPAPILPVQDAADAVAPPVPALLDAPTGVTCASACATMARFGCVQGRMSDCASSLCEVNADPRFRHYNLGCITAAQNALQVRGCGIDCTLEAGP